MLRTRWEGNEPERGKYGKPNNTVNVPHGRWSHTWWRTYVDDPSRGLLKKRKKKTQ